MKELKEETDVEGIENDSVASADFRETPKRKTHSTLPAGSLPALVAIDLSEDPWVDCKRDFWNNTDTAGTTNKVKWAIFILQLSIRPTFQIQ